MQCKWGVYESAMCSVSQHGDFCWLGAVLSLGSLWGVRKHSVKTGWLRNFNILVVILLKCKQILNMDTHILIFLNDFFRRRTAPYRLLVVLRSGVVEFLCFYRQDILQSVEWGGKFSHTHTRGRKFQRGPKFWGYFTQTWGGGVRGLIDCFKVGKWGGGGGVEFLKHSCLSNRVGWLRNFFF